MVEHQLVPLVCAALFFSIYMSFYCAMCAKFIAYTGIRNNPNNIIGACVMLV